MKKLIEKFISIFKSNKEEPETKQEGRIRVKAVGKKVKGLNPKKKKVASPHKLASEKKKRK